MSDRVWSIRCARGLALGAPRVTVKWRIRESGRRLEYIGPSANCAVLIPFQPSATLFAGIATYGPPVTPSLQLLPPEGLYSEGLGNRGYKLLPKSPRGLGIQRGGENGRNDGRVSRVKVGSRNRVAARISTIRKAAVVAAMALVLAKASGIPMTVRSHRPQSHARHETTSDIENS